MTGGYPEIKKRSVTLIYPKTADELIHWDGATGRDSFGIYTLITDYEGTGGCFWCGEDLNGKRRRFCGHRSGHWTEYANHFYWSYASSWALKRAGHRCENCGTPEIDIPMFGSRYSERSGLETHHIIPLKGEQRAVTPYNVPWNLICLCHKCHLEIHAVMRMPAIYPPPTIGQLFLMPPGNDMAFTPVTRDPFFKDITHDPK